MSGAVHTASSKNLFHKKELSVTPKKIAPKTARFKNKNA
jgi:hypothetical protein